MNKLSVRHILVIIKYEIQVLNPPCIVGLVGQLFIEKSDHDDSSCCYVCRFKNASGIAHRVKSGM